MSMVRRFWIEFDVRDCLSMAADLVTDSVLP